VIRPWGKYFFESCEHLIVYSEYNEYEIKPKYYNIYSNHCIMSPSTSSNPYKIKKKYGQRNERREK